MFCKKCGTKLSDDAKFCVKCGVGIERNNTENMKESVSNFEQEKIQKTDFDERFVKAYIGNKADKMYDSVKNGGFNIWGFLFGVGYFAYRKMYLISVAFIIICDLIALLIPKIGNYVGMIIGIMFYPLYKWDITRKLRKIKKDNPNANEGQLLYVAKNKGGTSAIGAITFYVVYILIIVFINLFIYMIGGEY